MQTRIDRSDAVSRCSFGLLGLFFIAGVFAHGYFLETEYLLLAIAGFLAVGALAFAGRISLRGDILLLLLTASAACYTVAAFFAVNKHAALLEAARYSIALPLYLLIRATTVKQRYWLLQAVFHASAVSVPLALLLRKEVDGRLAGFLDYANAYALLLLVALNIGLLLQSTARRMYYLPEAVILCAGIYLTQSRSVMLLTALTAIAFVVWLAFVKKNRRLALLLGGCGTVAALVVLAAGSSQLLARFRTLGSRNGGFDVRWTYYKDAYRMIQDYLWTGTGGGGWAQLQYEYQSTGYYVGYVHQSFLQAWLDAGIGAAAAFVLIAGLILYRCVRIGGPANQSRTFAAWGAFAGCAAILLQGLFDFTGLYPLLVGTMLLFSHLDGGAAAAGQDSRPLRLPVGLGALAAASLLVPVLLSSLSYSSALEAIAAKRDADAIRLLDRSARTAYFPDRVYDQKAKLYFRTYLQRREQEYLRAALRENAGALHINPGQVWYLKLRSDMLWEQGDRRQSLKLLQTAIGKNPYEERWKAELTKRWYRHTGSR